MAVVATTLVSEARSKMLAVVTSGEAGSYVKRPRALWATSSPRKVTASEQAEKARAVMAFSTMPKAPRNRSSCATKLRTRRENPDSRFGSVRFKGILWTDGVIAKAAGGGKPGSYSGGIVGTVEP
jgi:hypothetical protein